MASVANFITGHKQSIKPSLYPAGIWCENDVVLTSMRRDYVQSTLIRRHFGTKCPLGNFYFVASKNK